MAGSILSPEQKWSTFLLRYPNFPVVSFSAGGSVIATSGLHGLGTGMAGASVAYKDPTQEAHLLLALVACK